MQSSLPRNKRSKMENGFLAYMDSEVNPTLSLIVSEMLVSRPVDAVGYMIGRLKEIRKNGLCEGKSRLSEEDVAKSRSTSSVGTCGRISEMAEPLHISSEGKLISELSRSEAEQILIHLTNAETQVRQQCSSFVVSSDSEDSSSDSEYDDHVGELPDVLTNPKFNPKSRASVSAEVYGEWNKKAEKKDMKLIPKTDAQKSRIRDVMSKCFFFKELQEKDIQIIIDSMKEVKLDKNTRIIQQGDDGDVLYVIEAGELHCLQKTANPSSCREEPVAMHKDHTCEESVAMHKEHTYITEEGEGLVKICYPGDAFGELALLHNCPRAASVIAAQDSLLWELDRLTFNTVVRSATSEKREMHDRFLANVPILQSMNSWERAKIADALKKETFKKGEYILKQGESGNKFFIIEQGQAIATKSWVKGHQPQKVMEYKVGDYFGELALLNNEPRAANVFASSDVLHTVALDRGSFVRLLGPLTDLLTRQAEKYN